MRKDFNPSTTFRVVPSIDIPKKIYLYEEGIRDVDFDGIKKFVKDNFGNIKLCFIKLKEETIKTKGLLFDFLGTLRNFEKFKYAEEKESCHIILTNKLLATLDIDSRLHIRASIYGFPSVISISGIVEGPAKPKEYYLYKQRYTNLGIWEIEEEKVKKKFKSHFIDYNDKRISEVLKGYISQVIFFYLTGNPFCNSKNCRLFNSHWQEDLIYSQIKRGRFCKRHQELLKKVKTKIS